MTRFGVTVEQNNRRPRSSDFVTDPYSVHGGALFSEAGGQLLSLWRYRGRANLGLLSVSRQTGKPRGNGEE